MTNANLSSWERIWFTDGRAVTLVVARTLTFGCVAVDLITEPRFRTISVVGSVEWSPISLLSVLNLGAPPKWLVYTALGIALVSAVASVGRLAPRASGFIAAISYSFLLLGMNSLGKIYHDRNVLIILVWIMAFAAAPRLGDKSRPEFRWPVQMSRLVLGLMFLAAAWAKVRNGQGLEWVFGPNMRNVLASEILIFETPTLRGPILGDVAVWIAGVPVLWKAAAAGALIGEAVLVGAVFVRRWWLRTALVVLGVGTMVGITLLMGMVGFPIVVLALVFIDLDRLPLAKFASSPPWLDRRLIMPMAAFLIIGVVSALHRGNPLVAIPVALSLVVILLSFLRSTQADITQDESHRQGSLL